MEGTFFGASAFNQPLADWDVSGVTNLEKTFHDARAFNQPLNDWDVSRVESLYWTFAYASAFNQPLNDWDVSRVIWGDWGMEGTFIGLGNLSLCNQALIHSSFSKSPAFRASALPYALAGGCPSPLPLIIGAAAGAVVLLLLASCCFVYRKKLCRLKSKPIFTPQGQPVGLNMEMASAYA